MRCNRTSARLLAGLQPASFLLLLQKLETGFRDNYAPAEQSIFFWAFWLRWKECFLCMPSRYGEILLLGTVAPPLTKAVITAWGLQVVPISEQVDDH